MAPPEPGSTRSPAGDPTVAALLTWFVPGAGHLYLGRWRTALVAFALVEGLYLAGVALSGGLFLEYLPPEMRGTFAPLLTPEIGNVGALIWHVRNHPYLDRPTAWPATMHVGTALTALSGVLNLHVAAAAHLAARGGDGGAGRTALDPARAALCSWLVPGSGQFLQGRRGRGVVLFALLVGLFLLGCALAHGTNLDRERHFYYWAGQFLLGLPAVVAEFVHGHPRMTADVPYADAGVVIASIAGLLNVLVVLDAFAFGDRPPASGTDAARGVEVSA